MTKQELVSEISERATIRKSDAVDFLNAFTSVVSQELKRGEKVQIQGFGTFETSMRNPREGLNPATGEKIQIPGSVVPKFKAGKLLKNSVN